MSDETAWKAAVQVEDWAGELRVNLVRCAAIAAFYGQHLISFFVAKGAIDASYHSTATAVTIAWVAATVALHLCLRARWSPSWLPYAAVATDLSLTTLLLLASDGPRSPLLVLIPLIVASTAIRLNINLVRTSTFFAAIAYGAVLVHAYEFRPEWVVPRRQQAIFTLAIGCAGLIAGQAVRRAKRLAQDFHDRVVFLAARPGSPEGGRS